MAMNNSPYCQLLKMTEMPKSDYKNAISNLGGEYIDYYRVYFAKSSFHSELYTQYEHFLYNWMNQHYPTRSDVKYGYFNTSYELEGSHILCDTYSFETPYNILKLHIENKKNDPQTIYVASSISAKIDTGTCLLSIDKRLEASAEKEKHDLIEYIGSSRASIISSIEKLNDEYYDEHKMNCDIEYAMDHC